MSERGWPESARPHEASTAHVPMGASAPQLSTPYAPVSTGRVIRIFEAAETDQAELLHAHWPELAQALGELLRANGRGIPEQWRPR
ncbi:hypothetical protein IQ251_08365 [Saccharopolyspora sp. HNM0983]|uniref:Uncharacterized protein n=1 Tax=Saccharopolyspora montiporae TaxID=2781240 RepID=A0A929B751_9PSEU|nr:hypothetical protein [Saccharopolyspora sp. HNM0983]MBE9374462.1 hypothetical protein [Saccharopolyspora sp. HNM0983]